MQYNADSNEPNPMPPVLIRNLHETREESRLKQGVKKFALFGLLAISLFVCFSVSGFVFSLLFQLTRGTVDYNEALGWGLFTGFGFFVAQALMCTIYVAGCGMIGLIEKKLGRSIL